MDGGKLEEELEELEEEEMEEGLGRDLVVGEFEKAICWVS